MSNGWQCADVVRYHNLKTDRRLLECWFAKLSGREMAPRGRPPKCDWEAAADALKIECEKQGCVPPDRDGPKGWKTKADVERWTATLLAARKEKVEETAIRVHVSEILGGLRGK